MAQMQEPLENRPPKSSLGVEAEAGLMIARPDAIGFERPAIAAVLVVNDQGAIEQATRDKNSALVGETHSGFAEFERIDPRAIIDDVEFIRRGEACSIAIVTYHRCRI